MAQRLARIEQRLNEVEGARTTPWTGLSFTATWENYAAGNAECKYSKDSNGIVRIQGLLKAKANYSYGSVVTTLPEGYWPGHNHQFVGAYFDGTNVGMLYFSVHSNGEIVINGTAGTTANTGAAGSWITLSGVTYAASLG